MLDADRNKQIIQNFIQAVWNSQNLTALRDFWTEDCINHAMPGADNRGLDVLRAYHKQFFVAFSGIQVELVQQVAEGDRVVTHMTSRGSHSGSFFGIPATGKSVSMSAIRIVRIQSRQDRRALVCLRLGGSDAATANLNERVSR